MHRYFAFVTASAIACLSLELAASQEPPKQRTTMDPILRGVWLLHGSSKDKGKTVTEHDGEEFCRVSETKVGMLVGERKTLTVDKIIIIRDEDGDPGHVVRFENGVIWGITKKPKSKYVLIQVFREEDEQFIETIRFLITVKKND